MNIRNYSLIQSQDPKELVSSVTAAIGEGFQPIGGISVVREPAVNGAGKVGRTLYHQAMIRLYSPLDASQLIVPNGKVVG